MGAANTPAPADDNARPVRPSLVSARSRISYRKNTGEVVTLDLTNSKAAESLRALSKTNVTTDVDRKFIADVENAEAGGFVSTVYDALSFWVMEAVEIAMFGPYEEVQSA
ncbi:uncharacterized protein RCC_00474 [Ramularia collo-cygni]|uniref:Uncharacterized protein n=1 Tax=Ramularia collo-cygni TaxID=112498 RepID=A0A2D3UUD7_9PEZI|nr:uncharacterized protein RCC_00474 [Ramularia collo-cygni]CZT14496.1 uncharacterized protein RCC_00474 [Ramularia collo-cygni]